MARVNNLTNFLNDVATAIKQKLGDNTPIPASQFDTKIGEIETGGNYQTKSISITTNGNYTQLPDTGFDAMDQVVISVNVPSQDLSDATAQVQDIVRDKTAYTGNGKITGTFDKPIPIYESTDVAIMASRTTGYQSTEKRIFSYIDNYFAYTKTASSTSNWSSGIYCIEDSKTVRLVTTNGYKYISIVDVIDNYIYYALGMANYYSTLELYRCSKDGTTNERYWTIPLSKSCYTANIDFIDKSKLMLDMSLYIELDIPNKTITKSYSFGTNFSRALTTTIFTRTDYSSTPRKLYKPSLSLVGPNLSDYPRFVNAEENKIILNDNLYALNGDLSIGALIKEHIVTDTGLTVNDTYGFIQISGSYYWYLPRTGDTNATGGKICKFDNDTNSFTVIYDCSYLCQHKGNGTTGIQCSFLDSSNRIQYVLPDSQTQVLKGYHYDGHDMYFNNGSFVYSSSILAGYTAYDLIGTTIIGTMPNNGQLNYTPSTSQQSIPAGYTSGGTIGAVTSAIDQNIQAENIKKDVEILGVTGILEPDDPEYDTNLALTEQILGIEPYMIEVEKITSQIDDIDYPSSSYGSISLTPMKLEMHPQLNIPVTTEDATDIANLFNNGTSLTIELHNANGSGSQLLIADGGITFDCGHMAHISYEWKENPWGGTPGQMLATPVWSAEQAWDILDVESKSPLTQEDLDKVVTAFNNGWYPINEGYLRLQWSYRSEYTLTSTDKQNINSLLTYLFKYLGITLTDIPLT